MIVAIFLVQDALADGDPASDTLITQPVFLLLSRSYSPGATGELTALLDDSKRLGFPLKVAVIARRLDLGAVPSLYGLPQRYAIPAYFVLLAGAGWSAWRMRRRAELRDRMLGTLGIALGATVVAVGSGIGAAFGHVWLFSVGLAAGVAVMFWGFLRATSRPAPVAAS